MANVAGYLVAIMLVVMFLVLCSLPLVVVIRLWWGSYAISKARKQAEHLLAGEYLSRPTINETMAVLSTSRNSYNKELLARLIARGYNTEPPYEPTKIKAR